MTSMIETMRRAPLTAALLAVLLLGGAVACGGSEAGEGDSAKAGETAGAAGAEGEHGDEAEGVEVVVLDTTQQRLGGITVEPVATISTSGLPVTGTITYDANRVSHVGSRTEGRVIALRAELGARVGRGQALALLESPEVGQIRAEEREAEELVKIAEENFAREKRLAAQGISTPKEPPQPYLGRRRMQQVSAADDQVHVLAKVVHHDAEPVGPLVVAVADRQVAGRRDFGPHRPGQAVHPGLRSRTQRDPQHGTVQAALAAPAWAADPRERATVLSRPSVE